VYNPPLQEHPFYKQEQQSPYQNHAQLVGPQPKLNRESALRACERAIVREDEIIKRATQCRQNFEVMARTLADPDLKKEVLDCLLFFFKNELGNRI
jgi:hypothetical protein